MCTNGEAMFSKLIMIKWLNEGLCDKIFPLLGGFHTLLVKLKILHKKYGLLGMKDWWVDSSVVTVGSVDKAAEGKHYCRSTRVHKQSFKALVSCVKYSDPGHFFESQVKVFCHFHIPFFEPIFILLRQ